MFLYRPRSKCIIIFQQEMASEKLYTTFEDFYPFYLSQHSNQLNRRLHIIGTSLSFILFLRAIIFLSLGGFFFGLFVGYAFAWFGHFFIEKNTPATFTYPVYSLMGDFRMVYETLTGKRKFWFSISWFYQILSNL